MLSALPEMNGHKSHTHNVLSMIAAWTMSHRLLRMKHLRLDIAKRLFLIYDTRLSVQNVALHFFQDGIIDLPVLWLDAALWRFDLLKALKYGQMSLFLLKTLIKASDLFWYPRPIILLCCAALNNELETIDRNPAMRLLNCSIVRTKGLAGILA